MPERSKLPSTHHEDTELKYQTPRHGAEPSHKFHIEYLGYKQDRRVKSD